MKPLRDMKKAIQPWLDMKRAIRPWIDFGRREMGMLRRARRTEKLYKHLINNKYWVEEWKVLTRQEWLNLASTIISSDGVCWTMVQRSAGRPPKEGSATILFENILRWLDETRIPKIRRRDFYDFLVAEVFPSINKILWLHLSKEEWRQEKKSFLKRRKICTLHKIVTLPSKNSIKPNHNKHLKRRHP